LIDDVSLSKELNLDNSYWKDMPKDFYTFVGFKLKDFFNNNLNDSTVKLSEEDEFKK